MAQEGFIAASLRRSGWSVLYRATSIDALKRKLPEFPTALLIASDDFGDIGGLEPARYIQLRGRSHPINSSSNHNPQSEFELAELIRAQVSDESKPHIAATSAKVFAVSSISGYSGATPIAITVAEELSRSSNSVLLVEGNQMSPRIASHFQMHDIRGQVTSTHHGFSLCEVTDLQSLTWLAQESNSFDSLVIDLGAIPLAKQGGRRVGDQLKSWVSNSRARYLITARDDERSHREILRHLEESRLRDSCEVTVFLALSKILSRKERKKLMEERTNQYGTSVEIMSRDLRSIEKMEREHSTLKVSAPQSPITGDIARYLLRG